VASETVGLRTFFYVFQNPRKHGVLRFFELLHTFSRTPTQKNGDGQERYDTIRYDTRCYFNVRSKADMSRLNLPHGNDD